MTPGEKSAGFTLIEVLIASTIACAIFAAVLGLYAQVSSTYRVNDRIARLQEQGRFALAVMEPDIELAGYYGFTNTPESVRFVQGANAAVTLATVAQLRQFPANVGDPLPAPLAVLPPSAQACGINYAVDVALPVQGANNVFALGRGAKCVAYQSHPQLAAD